MNKENKISQDRKKYLQKKKREKILIKIVQFSIVIGIIVLWEVLANQGIIDSFIMSQPSRMVKTFFNLSTNNLLEHLKVTCLETLIGFLLGTFLGAIIAILLWWSRFLSKVSEPFLVVLNSLPKVALRTSDYYLGRSRNASHYCNGASHCDGTLMTTSKENSESFENTTKNMISVNENKIAELFSKISDNESVNKNIKIKVDRIPKEMPISHNINFADQLLYYRQLLGYTQKQVGQAIGISEDTYRRYELKEIEITDITKIKKLVKLLKFKEQPKLSNYVTFLMNKPNKKLQQYMKENNLSKTKFSSLSGISRRTITDWFNGKKEISKESFEKIEKFIIQNNNIVQNEEKIE